MSRDDCCEDRRCDCFHFRQNWTPGSIYKPGEAVSHEGSSYVAIHLNQGDAPPSPNWVTLAARGPQGSAGPAGPPGAMGPPGIAGVSDLYVFKSVREDNINVGVGGQDIARLRIPAGAYFVMASIKFANFDSDDQDWSFLMKLDGAGLASANGRATGAGDAGIQNGYVYLCAAVDSPTGGMLILHGSGYSIHVFPGSLQFMASKVGIIHPQS